MRNRINEINVTISDRDRDTSKCNWDGAFWHWDVKFDREGKSFTVPYYGGRSVEEITEEQVLHSCLLDALAFIQTDGFEDFCKEFGYDIDTLIKAEHAYNGCKELYDKFCRILYISGSEFEDVACEWLDNHDI